MLDARKLYFPGLLKYRKISHTVKVFSHVTEKFLLLQTFEPSAFISKPWLKKTKLAAQHNSKTQANPVRSVLLLTFPLTATAFSCNVPYPFIADGAAERRCSHQGQEAVQRHVCSQGHLWPHERHLVRHNRGKDHFYLYCGYDVGMSTCCHILSWSDYYFLNNRKN